jgi:hypothetical protein
VQFVGGAFILAGVTLVRVDELGTTPPVAGRRESPARVPELADTGVQSRAGRPDGLIRQAP